MLEQEHQNDLHIAELFDSQAAQYVQFAEQSYSWSYLERPAFDHYIPDLYSPETKVLDLACGTGRVIKHLINSGIKPENVIGIDISSKLLSVARRRIPGATFIKTSVDKFQLPQASFDLVTSNMMLHYLDNPTLESMLERVYHALKPHGVYFFVESDPDHSEESRRPENNNKWLEQLTPWGTMMPYFNRDARTLLTNYLDRHGFDYAKGWLLKVADAGRVNLEKYNRYSSKPSRIAARYIKVDESIKAGRNDPNWQLQVL